LTRRARLVAWSPIADDPRVRRMGDSLRAAGWDVLGIGLSGARALPPAWPIVEVDAPPPPADRPGAFAALERAGGRLAAAALAPIEGALRGGRAAEAAAVASIREKLVALDRPLTRAAAAARRRAARALREAALSPEDRLYAKFLRLSPCLPELERAAREAPRGRALWIANDWWTLPAAIAGLDRDGGALVYDSHEFATEEYGERPEWVRFQKPVVAAIEGRFIGRAALVSAVSPGIADALRERYALGVPVVTLRNTPRFAETPSRAVAGAPRILYHGLITPGRGLEEAIDAARIWRGGATLTFRGPSQPADYLAVLRARAAGLDGRVFFEPPVPMTGLVAAARPFDIGLMALPGHSLHAAYALPNKLFEYLMAGLALLVTDLPEMRRLVAETGAGFLATDASAQAITDAVNALTPEGIAAARAAALNAARRYNWETESAPVLDRFEALLDRPER
jgi:glycosyltransferase involved in cell wall biosynthesis